MDIDDEYQLDAKTLALLDSAKLPAQDLTAFNKRMAAVRDHQWVNYWNAWAEESEQRLARFEEMQAPDEIIQREREMLGDRQAGSIKAAAGLWPKSWSDLPDDYRMRMNCQCCACRFVRRSA